ncbi:MAG: regulator of sigma E protease [Candidatus Peregrinibacteria bacterium Greene1014_49]|nr:MAG: regulator of sigma E protease [Candidatus Peregrinibacteria bacterium Greene1014_49]
MFTVLLSAVAFLLLLSVLILIHEFGHFAAARKAGVEVEEFGFGLPPRARTLFSQGKTQFSLNWIPFGGFVRLKGENAMDEKERRSTGSFAAASVPARVAILVAGVFMNFILAIVLLTIGFSVGRWVPTYVSLEEMEAAALRGEIHLKLGVIVESVVEGGNAASAGVPSRSIIAAIDGQPVTHPAEVAAIQQGKTKATYLLKIGEGFREEKSIEVSLTEGKSGVIVAAYPIELSAPAPGILGAVGLALRESWVMMQQTVIGIGKLGMSLFTSGKVPEGITGIVGIAQLTHASVQQGFMTYLRLVALLSLSLAALNILPFPALDGGRLLFVMAEVITRRPVNRRFEVTTNAVGFGFLILLIGLITYHDIARLF